MFVPKLSQPAARTVPGPTGKPALRRPIAAMEPPGRPTNEAARGPASAAWGDLSRIPVFSAVRSRPSAEDRLAGGATATQATGPSAQAEVASAQGHATPDLSVTFGKVDSSTTPPGMPARIPPRIDQAVAVTLAGPESVEISLAGSPENGIATLDGGETVSLAASATITLRGTGQTPPGAGALQLVAKANATTVGLGNPFTICAIPTTVTIGEGKPIWGRYRGLTVQTYNDSDSGPIEDLDKVKMAEQVEVVNQQGCFESVKTVETSGYEDANNKPHGPDGHGSPTYLLDRPGSIDVLQYFVFADLRSGVGNTLVTNSGFKIRKEVTAVETPDETILSIETTKEGMAIASSGAKPGLGSATSGVQKV